MESKKGAVDVPPFFAVTGAYAGTVVYSPGGKYGPRVQRDLQLVLVHTGSMRVEIDGVPHHVPAKQAALLKPGHEEQFYFDGNMETRHRWIAVSVEPLHKDDLERFESLPLYMPLTERMNQLTDMLISLQNDGCERTDELIKSLGKSAIWLYLTEHMRTGLNKRKHTAVLLAIEEIRQRFGEELNLLDLSAAATITPEHLIRLFRRDEGVTPIQYLWKYRIHKGLELLRSTGLSVGEIAEQVGFKTSYHFARMIKRHTGLTPSGIREEHYGK
ncbi:AraC family transcriptional regulator [Paenibacillus sp. MBLB4367]|uniref:AraC family transcriptional regulator n=1 Tax=Paenibacillus sp. MBLB4367 TaxID=3384767 RepID=UPI0039082A60